MFFGVTTHLLFSTTYLRNPAGVLMSKIDQIIHAYPDDEFLIADGFDSAILGVDESSKKIIYSVKECLREIMAGGGATQEEAIEYFEFNVRGSYVGDKTPIWCDDIF